MDANKFQVLFYAVALAFPAVQTSAHFPLAQAKLESGNWTSHNYEVNNNMFGMTVPQVRKTTATNTNEVGAYAHYSNVLDGMTDYLHFLNDLGLTDDAKLSTYLKTKYAKDPAYYGKVSSIADQLTAAHVYIDRKVIYAGALATAVATALGVGFIVSK